MNVTMIGTGNMARAIGKHVVAGGHELTIVGKDHHRARTAAAALPASDGVRTAAIDDSIAADLVILGVYYADARAFVQQRADELTGKVVVDITNPVNETFDRLIVGSETSAAAEIAALAPLALLVKAFNTTAAVALTAGEVAGHLLDVLLAGDDDDAKSQVAGLVRDAGLRAVDAGGLDRARELEVLGLLNIRLQNALGTGFTNAFQLIGPR